MNRRRTARSITININSTSTIEQVLDSIAHSSNDDALLRQLAQDVKMFLWARYDPNDDIIYPTVSDWDDLLLATIDNNSYSSLGKDEVLSLLFGLIHRNRIVEGLWWTMFERGVTLKLLQRLTVLDTDKYR